MATQKNSLKSRWLSLSMRYTRIGSSQSVHSDPLWQQAAWSSLPHDILRDVIGRIDTSHDTWPDRTNLLACAAVCRSWRHICFDLVKPVQDSGLITFPSSLKQPGPRDGLMKCFIKRSKLTQTYYLYLSINEDVVPENGKFLLAARKYHYGRHCEYIISKSKQNFSSSSRSCFAKLRANFVGTKYVIHEAEQASTAANGDLQSVPQSSTKLGLKFLSKKPSPKFSPTGNIVYKQNFGFQGPPRKIEIFMHNIPSSIFKQGENSNLVLENKIPRWHEQLQCWCLNFSGRVTIASVKNFQLIEKFNLDEITNNNNNNNNNRDPIVIMQFGKVAKNIFSMDYQYPLSALQAFAIALSSFDHKLATE